MATMVEQSTGTPFTDLVRDRRAELGLSLRAFAEACVDPETGEQPIKYSWVDRLEKGLPVLIPPLADLRALAAGMRVPLRRLQDEASVQFLGAPRPAEWSPDSTVRAVVADMETMTEDDREDLRAMAALFARRSRERRERGGS